MRFARSGSHRRGLGWFCKSLLVLLVFLGLVTATNVVSLPSAGELPRTVLAGGNGQQLVFIDTLGDVYSICVSGYNNNGAWVSNYCWNTPNKGRNNPPPSSPHWVGIISINERWLTGSTYRREYPVGSIPRSQSQAYWCLDDYEGGQGYACN
jgi:hypothetical protein